MSLTLGLSSYDGYLIIILIIINYSCFYLFIFLLLVLGLCSSSALLMHLALNRDFPLRHEGILVSFQLSVVSRSELKSRNVAIPKDSMFSQLS